MSDVPSTSAVSDDPFAPPPSWLQRNAATVAPVIVFVTTVVLTVLAFPPLHTPEFAYAMLVPGTFWAYLAPRWKTYIWTMFAAQAVAWTILLGWLHHVTWVGLFLLGPFVGAWVGTWFLAARWTMPRLLGRIAPVRMLALLGLAGAWVLIEWTRTWLLSGFPWLPLAASQWERSSILQIAAFTGQEGVSFVLVAMNIGFAAYAHRLFREGQTGLRKRSQEFFLALFLLLVCLSVQVQETFNRFRYNVPLARVAFVQPDIPQAVKWNPAEGPHILDVLKQTTLQAAAQRPDLILWPEASTPWAIKGDANSQDFAESLVRQAGAPLLAGTVAIENPGKNDERWFNAVVAVDPIAGLQHDFYAKRHLVPFGEYVPLRPLLGWLHKFVEVGEDDYTPGDDASPLVLQIRGNPITFGPLICYEDVFPELARRSVLAGADVLFVATNDAWYGTGGAAYQHAAHAVLRAIETRRPVLRCGNAGWSGWIDEFGAQRDVLRDDNGSVYFRGTKTVTIMRDARWAGRNSFYVEYGDWFIGVCLLLAILAHATLTFGRPPEPAPKSSEPPAENPI